jgi:hypothetical protein
MALNTYILQVIFIFVMIFIVATFLHNDLRSNTKRVDVSECNDGKFFQYFNVKHFSKN